MITAIPAVKPTMTGLGMNLITVPSRAMPMSSKMTPAMSVAICKPAIPWVAVMPASTAMNAPVGPEICTRVPPNSDVATPATIAVYRPCAGVTPDAIANAMARGSATTPTTRPAAKSRGRCARANSPARWASSRAIIDRLCLSDSAYGSRCARNPSRGSPRRSTLPGGRDILRCRSAQPRDVYDVRRAIVDERHDVTRLLRDSVHGHLRGRFRVGLRVDTDPVRRIAEPVANREARPVGGHAG